LSCAGQNINTKNVPEPPSKEPKQTTNKKPPLETLQKNTSFENIDDAYMAMDQNLDQLTDEAVKSAFELAVNTLKEDPGHMRANIVLFNAHLYKANEEQVLEQFKKLITLQPTKPESCIELGTLLARLGKIPHAIVFFQKSIDLDASFSEGYYNLARAKSLMRQFDQAINAYKKTIELSPKHYRAWNNLGWIYMLKKDFKKATEHINKALEIKPDYSVAYLNLGTISLLQKDLDQAEKEFKTYIKQKPEKPDGYRNLATVYQHKQQFDDAISAFRELLKIKPDDYVAMNNLAVMLLSKAKYGESVRLLQQVYLSDVKNEKIKSEVKKSLSLASFHLAETLSKHDDKKELAIKAYKDYLKYSEDLPDGTIQKIKDKISALQ
jgi:tetratricopeptide (TPR) repeat protein